MEKLVENKRQYERMCEAISALQFGETITHRELAGVIGEKSGTTKYYTIIQKARKILLNDYKICLESVREIGYRKVLPDDFVKVSMNEVKGGFKKIQKGTNILINSPVNDMSPEAREEHRLVCDKMRETEARLRSGLGEVKRLRQDRQHPFAAIVGA